MIAMQLSEAANAVEGELTGSDGTFIGISTDTRSLVDNQLFFALRGPRFDAHEKIDEAAVAGAAGAVVERACQVPMSLIHTSDSRRSLGCLARNWRTRFQVPVLAVTGSSGKTTVKEMLASILRVRGKTLATKGNLNNDIGLPLTLFGLSGEHDFAVIEMGANQPGDIAWLSEIARPTVGVITLVAPAHLEGFGDLETVARAKGEILSGLDPDGIAVINYRDQFAQMWFEMAADRRVITFGEGGMIHGDATIDEGQRTSFRLHTDIGDVDATIAYRGRHNVDNALAAAAVARAVDSDLESIRIGLERASPVPGRLQLRRGIGGVRLIDDSYNANPVSLQAALDVLAEEAGEKWLVLGDMAELGDESESYHREAGRAALRAGVDKLFAIGEWAQFAVHEFDKPAKHLRDRDALVEVLTQAVRQAAAPNITILIKGSRVMALDELADALTDRGEAPC